MKVGEASALAVSADFVEGIQNWAPRGTITASQAVEATQQDSIDSSIGWLTLAVPSSYTQTEIVASIEVANTSGITPISYMYNRGSNVSLISGRDDSSAGISLSFTSADVIVVYVNGIELSSNLYSTAIANRISFSPVLSSETNQIQVFVYSAPTTFSINISFNKITSATVNSSAWANVSSIKIQNAEYSLYLAKITGLTNNSFNYFTALQAGSSAISLDEAVILRAYPPYSNYDRDLFNFVKLSSISSLTGLFNYTKNIVGEYQCFIDQGLLTASALPISIINKISSDISSSEVNSSNTLIQNTYST